MPVDPQLRSLNIDIPAQPEALVRLSLLLADDDVNLQSVTALIEADMGLAAAVLKAVNSSMYGLAGRVRNVHQAITYLGMREVASVTFAMGLKAVFPHAPELEVVWERAAARGLLMGRIGHAIGADAWTAHTAGLFEECGKAILYRHAADRYRHMLKLATNDEELVFLEHQEFGVSHEALGAALCETWGLAGPVAHCVRYHVVVNATRQLPMQVEKRELFALCAVANAMMVDPALLPEVVQQVAPQVPLDAERLLQGALRVQRQIESAVAEA